MVLAHFASTAPLVFWLPPGWLWVPSGCLLGAFWVALGASCVLPRWLLGVSWLPLRAFLVSPGCLLAASAGLLGVSCVLSGCFPCASTPWFLSQDSYSISSSLITPSGLLFLNSLSRIPLAWVLPQAFSSSVPSGSLFQDYSSMNATPWFLLQVSFSMIPTAWFFLHESSSLTSSMSTSPWSLSDNLNPYCSESRAWVIKSRPSHAIPHQIVCRGIASGGWFAACQLDTSFRASNSESVLVCNSK